MSSSQQNDDFIQSSSKNRALAALFLCASEENLKMESQNHPSAEKDILNCNSTLSTIAAASFSIEDGIELCSSVHENPKHTNKASTNQQRGIVSDIESRKFLSIFCGIKKTPKIAVAETLGDIRPHCKALCENEIIAASSRECYPASASQASPRPSIIEFCALNNQASAIASICRRCLPRDPQFPEDDPEWENLPPSAPQRQYRDFGGGTIVDFGMKLSHLVFNVLSTLPNPGLSTLLAMFFVGSRAASGDEKNPDSNKNNFTMQWSASLLGHLMKKVVERRSEDGRVFQMTPQELRSHLAQYVAPVVSSSANNSNNNIIITNNRKNHWKLNDKELAEQLFFTKRFIWHFGETDETLFHTLKWRSGKIEEQENRQAVLTPAVLKAQNDIADHNSYFGLCDMMAFLDLLRAEQEDNHHGGNNTDNNDNDQEDDAAVGESEEEEEDDEEEDNDDEEEEEEDSRLVYDNYDTLINGETRNYDFPFGVIDVFDGFENDRIIRKQSPLHPSFIEENLIFFRKDHHRLNPGQDCFAPREVFEKRFNSFCGGVFDGFKSDFAFAIGGAVVTCLQPVDIVGDLLVTPSSVSGRDIDVVFCGLDPSGVLLEVLRFDRFMRQVHPHHLACYNASTITYVLPEPQCSVQIILGSWNDIQTCLKYADVDCCAVACSLNVNNETNQRRVVTTARGLTSWIFRTNVPTSHSHAIRGSPSYEERLLKYARREHFQVLQYDFTKDTSSNDTDDSLYLKLIDPKFQKTLKMNFCHGLVWLFMVDIGKFKPNLDSKKATGLQPHSKRGLWQIKEEVEEDDYVASDGYGGTESGYKILNLNHLPADEKKKSSFGDGSKNGLFTKEQPRHRWPTWFSESNPLVYEKCLSASPRCSSLNLANLYQDEVKVGEFRIRPRPLNDDEDNNNQGRNQKTSVDSSRDEAVLSMRINHEKYIEIEEWDANLTGAGQ